MSEALDIQWKLIYAIIVAGKSATFTEGVVERLKQNQGVESAFAMIRRLIYTGSLDRALKKAGSGNYTRIGRALRELVASGIDLATCKPFQLEAIHGIGPKTARFFILWTRPDYRCAALDVHVLHWLRDQGHDAPPATPTGRTYRRLEQAFLREADKRGMTPRQLDSLIWESASGYAQRQAS